MGETSMLERLRSLAMGLSLLVVVGGVALYAFVALGGGETLLGSGNGTLEAVNFSALDSSADQTGYLLCDPDICPAASPDGPSVVLDAPLTRVRRIVAGLEEQSPLASLAVLDIVNSQFDFVVRDAGSALGTVVAVKLDARGQGTDVVTRMSVYSYRPIGGAQTAASQQLVSRWIANVQAALR